MVRSFLFVGTFNELMAPCEDIPTISITELKSVCTDLGPGVRLITWPILNRFPDFKK